MSVDCACNTIRDVSPQGAEDTKVGGEHLQKRRYAVMPRLTKPADSMSRPVAKSSVMDSVKKPPTAFSALRESTVLDPP